MDKTDRIEKVDKEVLGSRLKSTRKARKLTQKEVCGILGIPQSNLSLYETGEYSAPLNVLVSYAKTYNISIDYLLGLSETESTVDVKKLLDKGKITAISSEDELTLKIDDEDLKSMIQSLAPIDDPEDGKRKEEA